jgi:hypothetical protein
LIYIAGMLLLAIAIARDNVPKAAALGLAAGFPAALASRWCWQNPVTFYRTRPAQVLALLAFVVMSAGISTGVLLG